MLSVPVKAGEEVRKGSVLMVLEAMKMEMLIESPADGQVAEILANPGTQVAAGQSLIRLEEAGDSTDTKEPAAVKIDFPHIEPGLQERWERIANEVQAIFLGFDAGEDSSDLVNRIDAFITQNPDRTDAFYPAGIAQHGSILRSGASLFKPKH